MKSPSTDAFKLAAAREAIGFVRPGEILGVGSGSTVNIFIALLGALAHAIPGAVAASETSAEALRQAGIPVLGPNIVTRLSVYVDGADEVDPNMMLIKGGGAALTREKILAYAATSFVCVVDESKRVARLGAFALPIEVIGMTTNAICRHLSAMGGSPCVRSEVLTDNGNSIVDVTGLNFNDPVVLETALNQLPGAVCNGIFAQRPADICISAGANGLSVQRR